MCMAAEVSQNWAIRAVVATARAHQVVKCRGHGPHVLNPRFKIGEVS